MIKIFDFRINKYVKSTNLILYFYDYFTDIGGIDKKYIDIESWAKVVDYFEGSNLCNEGCIFDPDFSWDDLKYFLEYIRCKIIWFNRKYYLKLNLFEISTITKIYNLFDKFIDWLISPEIYVKNVKEVNRNYLTYKPELYSLNDNLPRPIKFIDTY